MTHVHGDVGPRLAARRQVRILLALLVTPFAVATVAGLVLLWPERGSAPVPAELDRRPSEWRPSWNGSSGFPCSGTEEEPGAPLCTSASARITTGAHRGETVDLPETGAEGYASVLEPGDRIVVAQVGADQGGGWYFEDFARRRPMLILAVVFAAAVILLGRWRGLFSVVGLVFSLLLLVRFVLPPILEGNSPVTVAVVGASAVMFVGLYGPWLQRPNHQRRGGHPGQPAPHRENAITRVV